MIGLPDPERGERVCAVVERAPGVIDLAFDEMVATLNEARLMKQKIPEQLEIVHELPRKPSRQGAQSPIAGELCVEALAVKCQVVSVRPNSLRPSGSGRRASHGGPRELSGRVRITTRYRVDEIAWILRRVCR